MVRICSLVIFLLGTSLTIPALAQVAADVDVVANLAPSNLAYSRGALLLASDGNFYGTTSQGGAHHPAGAVFRMTPAGVVTTLHSFHANVDGYGPSAHLIQGSDGKLYGVTIGGGFGAHPNGTVFRVALDGTFEHLHSFGGGAVDGGFPSGGVVQASDGNYYGTTQGTIWKITPAGVFSLLYGPVAGFTTIAGLVEGADGRLYGNGKDIYVVDLAGNYTALHTPSGAEGFSQGGELIQASDGAFYGTARAGGAGNCGTIFRYDLVTDQYTVLFSFNGANGCEPYAGLVEASDGFLYGTTWRSTPGFGTIFRISKAGMLTTLHTFDRVHGEGPMGELIETSPDVFYGTTLFGGTPNPSAPGVVFRMTILRSNLEVTNLKAPAAAAAGGPLKVTDTTANTGSGGSGATTTRLWLSQDASLGGGDFALGGRAVGALADGAQSKGSTNVTLPNVAPGSYFVLAEADGDEEEAETDETDNVRAKKILIGPDLTIKSMVLSPPAPSSTSPTTVTVTVKNAGGATADPTVVRLYRSSNGSFGAGDSLITEIAFPAIAAGAQNAQAVQVTFAAGSYYVLAIADGGGVVAEANEGNNLKKVKLNVP